MATARRLGGDGVQINWTLVAGLAALSLAAAANWDAGTAARQRRGAWRTLTLVYLVLLAELIGDTRFGAVAGIDAALPGVGRHMVQIGLALLMLVAAGGAAIAIVRIGRRSPWFAPAGMAALAMAASFGAEILSVGPVGALLYRPIGPIMLIGWLWLACGAAAVAIAALAVRSVRTR
ncbi:hypothetical protein GCM10022268_05710 [Sphingomonas cynarae]|uniref:DUF998 domain-containing protein n=1 Tax=Sphingomonas cynarae TaxID=930197 RepID=A0ABP7CYD1_9SPHN